MSRSTIDDEAGSRTPAAARRRQRLEHIHSAGRHLLALIDDVLDLSSLEGGELRIALEPVALEPLVRETLPLLGGLAARGVRIETGVLVGHAMADATRLRLVLLNLLSNAVEYNREGGHVTVDTEPRGERLVLRVADSGLGLDEQQMRHLFEPFNRLGREALPGAEDGGAVEGTGIGLAIVKALVERMGGQVRVQSAPGAGSVFEVELAAAPDAAPEAPPRRSIHWLLTACQSPLPQRRREPPRPMRRAVASSTSKTTRSTP